ncbi:MAG: hypothetical protein ABI353_12180 [Isosphaeraceae bacterium]
MRVRLCALPALSLSILAGCGGSDPGPAVPKTITISQAAELPLEDAGDLSIRQNLAEQPMMPILGRDSPFTTASR